jgi:hypothetical protein
LIAARLQPTPFPGHGESIDSSAARAEDTVIVLTAVVVAVTEEIPRVLVVRYVTHALATPAQQGPTDSIVDSPDALPFGPFEPSTHRTLELGLRSWVEEQTGLPLRYVEQLYTFGDRYRDVRELEGGPRVVSVGYIALVRQTPLSGTGAARWHDWFDYLPWEDWRNGRPAVVSRVVEPALAAWIDAADDTGTRRRRRERVSIAFGLGKAAWDFERTLDRFELLYEVGLIAEALRDRRAAAVATGAVPSPDDPERLVAVRALGAPMALDNRRILATALGRLRGKLKYRPVVFDLLPSTFTLLRLQRTVEALGGVRLHKQNFRRMVLKGGLVEATGGLDKRTGGRPAELFRFRRDVLRERLAPGVGLPAIPISG